MKITSRDEMSATQILYVNLGENDLPLLLVHIDDTVQYIENVSEPDLYDHQDEYNDWLNANNEVNIGSVDLEPAEVLEQCHINAYYEMFDVYVEECDVVETMTADMRIKLENMRIAYEYVTNSKDDIIKEYNILKKENERLKAKLGE